MIVVGVEGTQMSREALIWALREGKIRNTAVQVVHAWRFDPTADFLPAEQIRRDSIELLDREITAVTGEQAPERVSRSSIQGAATRILPELSGKAELLVLGSHQRGLVGEIVLGSVSSECVRHARCPVVVVPGTKND